MARFARRGLMLALESEPESEINPITKLEEVHAEVNESVPQLIEQDEACGEEAAAIESLIVAIEEVLDEAESIEEVIDTVHEVSVNENGEMEGLTDKEAALAEESLRVIYRRLGIPMHNVMPATEGFRTKSTRVSSTQVAVEGMMDTLKKIWHSITSSMSRVIDRFRGFLKNAQATSVEIAQAAENLKEGIKLLKELNAKPHVTQVEDKSVYRHFVHNGPINVSVINEYLGAHRAQTLLAQKVTDVIKAAEDVAKIDASTTLEHIEKSVHELLKLAIKNVTGESSTVELDGSEHVVQSKYRLIRAERMSVRYTVKMDAERNEYRYSVSVDAIEEPGVQKSPQALVVDELNALSKLCDTIAALAKLNEATITQYLNASGTLQKVFSTGGPLTTLLEILHKGVISVANPHSVRDEERKLRKEAKAQNASFVKEHKKVIRMLAEVLARTDNAMVNYATQIVKENITACRSALAYIRTTSYEYIVDEENMQKYRSRPFYIQGSGG
jgi:hypothetical protein